MTSTKGCKLLVSLACIVASGCAQQKPPPPAPPTVLVAPVARQDVALFIEAVGTLDGYVNADIRARVKGYLRSQNYKDGSPVKEGQLLFTIEPAEYVNAAAVANATLVRANAAKDIGRVSLDRNQALAQQGLVSRQVVDDSVAQAADSNGQVLAAQAALSQAQLNLSYTQIHAPVSGLAGLALVRVGNLVGQDSPTLLTTVSQLDPIRVNFPTSEIDYVRCCTILPRTRTAAYIRIAACSSLPTAKWTPAPAPFSSRRCFRTRRAACAPVSTAACAFSGMTRAGPRSQCRRRR
jgi:multidrug efflux pump subunit AcrA (membrane-fusion protein)